MFISTVHPQTSLATFHLKCSSQLFILKQTLQPFISKCSSQIFISKVPCPVHLNCSSQMFILKHTLQPFISNVHLNCSSSNRRCNLSSQMFISNVHPQTGIATLHLKCSSQDSTLHLQSLQKVLCFGSLVQMSGLVQMPPERPQLPRSKSLCTSGSGWVRGMPRGTQNHCTAPETTGNQPARSRTSCSLYCNPSPARGPHQRGSTGSEHLSAARGGGETGGPVRRHLVPGSCFTASTRCSSQ